VTNFKLQQRVKVTQGEYEGYEGELIGIETRHGGCIYFVSFGARKHWFCEWELEAIHGRTEG